MRKKFFVLSMLIFGSILVTVLSCNNDSSLSTFEDLTSLKTDFPTPQNNFTTLQPNCLNETVVDSFIYYANEFTNYLMVEGNLENPYDSIQLSQIISHNEATTKEQFLSLVSETWNIPISVVNNFATYSFKIKEQLSRETMDNHPIASRFYYLIKSGCLHSELSSNYFETEELFIQQLLRGCSFWGLFSSCGKAALASFAACAAPSPITVGVAVFAIGDYISTVSKC